MSTVGATCEVHLMLRGMVDAEKEVARLEEKIQKLNGQVDKIKKTMNIKGYEDKVQWVSASWYLVYYHGKFHQEKIFANFTTCSH